MSSTTLGTIKVIQKLVSRQERQSIEHVPFRFADAHAFQFRNSPYIRPQENGTKNDIRRWKMLSQSNNGIKIVATAPFSASALYIPSSLWARVWTSGRDTRMSGVSGAIR